MSIALQFLCKCSRSRYCSRLRPAIITIFQYQTCSYSNTKPESHKSKTYQLNSNDAQQRWNELRSFKGSLYPRIEASEDKISCQDFLASYKGLDLGETIESTSVTISGIFAMLESGELAHAYRKDTIFSHSRLQACLP